MMIFITNKTTFCVERNTVFGCFFLKKLNFIREINFSKDFIQLFVADLL